MCFSSTMGTCTSTARHRHKLQQQSRPNRPTSKSSLVFDIDSPPPLPPLPSTAFPNQQRQHSQPLFTDFDLLSPALVKPAFHQADTNSLIQFYSFYTNANNNNNNNNNNFNTIDRMSSSSSSIAPVAPRIPVPKTRLPTYHAPQVAVPAPPRPKETAATVTPANPTGNRIPSSHSIVCFH